MSRTKSDKFFANINYSICITKNTMVQFSFSTTVYHNDKLGN